VASNKNRKVYASINSKYISASIYGRQRFRTFDEAVQTLERIRQRYHLCKNKVSQEPNTETLWIKWFEVSDQDAEDGWSDNGCMLSIEKLPDGKFTLRGQLIRRDEMPSRTPHPKNKKSHHPNWGDPILRKMKRKGNFGSLQSAMGALDQLVIDYPNATDRIADDKLNVFVYVGTSPGSKKNPIEPIVVRIHPASGGSYQLDWQERRSPISVDGLEEIELRAESIRRQFFCFLTFGDQEDVLLRFGNAVCEAIVSGMWRRLGRKSLKAPKEIFHFCTQDTMMKIAESKSLWMTELRFMNDREELGYGIELTGRVAKEMVAELSEEKEAEQGSITSGFVSMLAKEISSDSVGNEAMFASCFTETRISIGQWREYGARGDGFAIGFDFHNLANAMEGGAMALVRVQYYPSRQEEILKDIIRGLLKIANSKKVQREEGDLSELAAYSVQKLLLLSGLFKNPAFLEEREWRLVTRIPISKYSEQVKKRTNPIAPENELLAIPYTVLEFSNLTDTATNIVSSVTVGPTHQDGAMIKASTETFLRQLGYTCPISLSDVPFRRLRRRFE